MKGESKSTWQPNLHKNGQDSVVSSPLKDIFNSEVIFLFHGSLIRLQLSVYGGSMRCYCGEV